MPTYAGTVTTTGSSEAVRLDKAFFRRHPEFRQRARVRAQVLAPGVALVSVVDAEAAAEEGEDDPVLAAFLATLAADLATHPERLSPLSEDTLTRAAALVEGVTVTDDERLPDDVGL